MFKAFYLHILFSYLLNSLNVQSFYLLISFTCLLNNLNVQSFLSPYLILRFVEGTWEDGDGSGYVAQAMALMLLLEFCKLLFRLQGGFGDKQMRVSLELQVVMDTCGVILMIVGVPSSYTYCFPKMEENQRYICTGDKLWCSVPKAVVWF